MTLPFPADDAPGVAPMEARLVAALPTGAGWQYEPKWDGFRCIAWKEGYRVALRSRSGKPLGRYFPEIEAMLADAPAERFAIDGELLIARGDALSFAALQARLHPAESRVRRLAAETPAQFMLFDCLADGDRDLLNVPLDERRAALEGLHRRIACPSLPLSPRTFDAAEAAAWLARAGGALDGIVAKRRDLAYRPGERAMAKLKQHRTADCVVGGFRYATERAKGVGSLLLGLYDEAGRLDHVGFTSGLDAATRLALVETLEPLIGSAGFTGDAPADRAAGRPTARPTGSRCAPSWLSRSATTRSPMAASATPRASCAGARTRPRKTAGGTSSRPGCLRPSSRNCWVWLDASRECG